MRLLVTGSESSGTRMMCAMLIRSGAEVVHSSPAYKDRVRPDGGKYWPHDYDAVCIVIRNGAWNAESLVRRGHLKYDTADKQIAHDLFDVLDSFVENNVPVYVVTYESLVYEQPHSFDILCAKLGLTPSPDIDPIQNANEKFFTPGGGWAGDDRPLHERF